MARIDSLGESYQYPVPEKKKTGKKEKASRKAFSHMVESAAEGGEATGGEWDGAGHGRTLEQMLDEVFSTGEQLKRAATLESVKDYRQKVRAFVKYAVQHSIAVEETTSGASILKRKRFTLVKVIDEKLDALAISVLAAQKEQFSLLAQIDEINGLLVDLVG